MPHDNLFKDLRKLEEDIKNAKTAEEKDKLTTARDRKIEKFVRDEVL